MYSEKNNSNSQDEEKITWMGFTPVPSQQVVNLTDDQYNRITGATASQAVSETSNLLERKKGDNSGQ